ncbi:MAG: amidohydrolase family protein [Rubrivivax sp.]|nr:amidohydrolase family protein [Rubrivivax sp.]MBK8528473.1 amidohydrolase family protein [Rubrivivax sp.]
MSKLQDLEFEPSLNSHLRSVGIPPSLRGFESKARDDQAFDVAWRDGRVSDLVPVTSPVVGTLLSAMVDLHVHLDKNYTVDEVGAAHGDLSVAIERMAAKRAGWTAEALHARMTRGLEDAWRCGTRALRTHLDWPDAPAPKSLPVLLALREQWRNRIELQFVSLTALDRLDGHAGAVASAVAHAGGILGAFVYRNANLQAKLQRVFELAVAHDLDLDFHVDEGLDPTATGLRCIADLTTRHRWQHRVTCGHACSLSVQPAAEAAETLRRCASAGIHLVALPNTNLYLQGAWDGTPLERGITRLREAAAAGVQTSIATDNVGDSFYPYGSYDLFETFGLGVQMAHLAPVGAWLPAVTVQPARAMRLAWDGLIRIGCPADLIVLDARTEHEMLTPRGRQRTVFRNGTPIARDGTR